MGSIMDYLTLDTMGCTTAREDENGKLRWHKHKAKIINGMEIHIYTSEEKCLAAGGHCWKNHNSMPIRACKHCGHVQKGTRQPGIVWENMSEDRKALKADDSILSDTCSDMYWFAGEYKPDTFPISEQECLDMDGHCWEYPRFVHPTMPHLRWCKHCGHEQIGRTQPEIVWKGVEEKERT